ncbi:hypothetical protein AAG570_009573 [Ranatra chinensis]|uniref:WD repeat protein mio zinc-ribbon like domain-containing protein n=1 Tax=Ranatra chinensis TaxID=642074 RepID=A0ABD0Z0A6_9HEMI
MSGVRLEVLWSPVHYDKFVAWGTEIFLYQTLPKTKDASDSSGIELSEMSSAQLLATNSNHHYLKCVDIYPKEEPDVLLAVGQANGKVALSTFGPSAFDASGLAGMELVPKHARQCNVVAWNRVDTNLIAAGLDRYRSDHCVLVWDVCSGVGGSGVAAVAELGLSDAAHSLAWLYSQPRALIVGMNNKHLKMVDLRDPSKAVNSSQTKAVHGLTVSAHNDYQVASFVDTQIAVWDTRSFDKPVLTMPQIKPVTKLLWCPTRHNLLGSLQRESRSIHLHDLQQSADDSADPSVLERSVKPGSASQITSFSWHPKHENRLLVLTLQGTLTDFCVFERITLNWSQTSHLVWTHGQNTLKMMCDSDTIYDSIGDISSLIKKRALLDYGLKTELKENAELVNEEGMKKLWLYLHQSKTLVKDGLLDLSIGTKLPPGVRSELRDKALLLCNWKFVHDTTAFQQIMEELEAEGAVTRGAALAVFSLRLRHSIKLLSTETKYSTVAMALSGYTEDKNSMWRESCTVSRTKLSDPYLRAIFAFLTADSENYDLVLNDGGMAVADRVGFALTFLSDLRLVDFITQLTDNLISDGNLAGILLTGGSIEALHLLQNYVDKTGDVQSVSLVAMRSFSPDLLDHDRTQYWINSYRDLLDSWRLWTQRAHFDIWHNRRTGTRPEQQIYVSCNFCGKSTSTQSLTRNKATYPRLGTSSNQNKMTCCPHCRKPQPRCSICLVNMGTASCYQPENSGTPTTKINPFDYWFTWCQTCRHGGHAAHMTQWFKEHLECPVTACSCRCLSLDAASNIISVSSVS